MENEINGENETQNTENAPETQEMQQIPPETSEVKETSDSGEKPKKTKKKFNIKNLRVNFADEMQALQANGKYLAITVAAASIFMILVCLAVFFMTVKGPEKVLVPDVEGKELSEALIEMQVKELYPKIQMRYPENQEEFGQILSQTPDAGSIVKAGTRVTLTVSRGAVVEEIENYIGRNFDELKLELTTMFAGTARPLIVLADPIYKADMSDAGTILEQEPPEGTKISNPVTVNLVVSRGPNYENTRVPNFVGDSLEEILSMLPNARVVLDFTVRYVSSEGQAGFIVAQQQIDSEYVPNYSRIGVEISFPERTQGDTVYGLFTANLANYPYPVEMELEATEPNMNRYTVTSMNHTGGSVTIPYCLPAGTELTLKVAGRIAARATVTD